MKIYILVKESGQYDDYRTENIAVYADKLLAESNRDYWQKEADKVEEAVRELDIYSDDYMEQYKALIKDIPLEFTDYNVKYHVQEFDMETSLDYLSQAKHNLFETFLAVSDEFDGTENTHEG
jgi:hypothetical protein